MIAEALEHFCPGKQYSLNGNTYEGLVWLEKEGKPTKEQVDSWVSQIQPIIANKIAHNNRANAYRLESDPLFFKWQRGEATEQEYLDKVEEIRHRFPYEGEIR